MYGAEKQALAAMGDYRGAMLGGSAAGMEAKRMPEVLHELDRLEKALTALDGTAREMQARLEGITRPPEPMPATTAANQIGPVGPSTGVGMRVHHFAEQVDEVTDRLQNVLRRLEV
jgi:hypothetical protein